MMDRHGADAVAGSAGRRLAVVGPRSGTRRCPRRAEVLLTYWNRQILTFKTRRTLGWAGDGGAKPPARITSAPERPRGIAEPRRSHPKVTAAIGTSTKGAGDCSPIRRRPVHWYVRRSRRRCWTRTAALETLQRCRRLTRLMAPFTRSSPGGVRAVAPAWGQGSRRQPRTRDSFLTEVDDAARDDERWPRGSWAAARRAGSSRPGRRPRCAPASPCARVVAAPAGRSPPARSRGGRRRDERRRVVELSRSTRWRRSVKIDFRAVGRRMGKQVSGGESRRGSRRGA